MTNDQAERIILLLESIEKKLSSDAFKSPYSMGAKEAAKYVNISYGNFLKMVETEKIPHNHAGKRLIFRSDSLDLWIKNRESQSVKLQATYDNPELGKLRRIKA